MSRDHGQLGKDEQVKVGVNLAKFSYTAAQVQVTDPFSGEPVAMSESGLLDLKVPGRRITYFQISLK